MKPSVQRATIAHSLLHVVRGKTGEKGECKNSVNEGLPESELSGSHEFTEAPPSELSAACECGSTPAVTAHGLSSATCRVPVQYTQGPEGVPSAVASLAFVQVDWHRAGVTGF